MEFFFHSVFKLHLFHESFHESFHARLLNGAIITVLRDDIMADGDAT